MSTPVYPEHPDDIAADGGTRVVGNYRSCQSHCCLIHGCKYGYEGCPVETGQVTQDHPCEQCSTALDDAASYSGTGYSKAGEVGYTMVLGLKRQNTDDTAAAMENMPTDEQVVAAVTEALAGLSINGWALTRVLEG